MSSGVQAAFVMQAECLVRLFALLMIKYNFNI